MWGAEKEPTGSDVRQVSAPWQPQSAAVKGMSDACKSAAGGGERPREVRKRARESREKKEKRDRRVRSR